MSLWSYGEENAVKIIGNLFLMVLLSLYLKFCGNSTDVILWILAVWVVILAAGLGKGYFAQRKKYREIWDVFEQLEEKYLISEILKKPELQMEQVYLELVRGACKSMLEKIETVEKERRAYKEYIEDWIHEVKTPIAGVELICSNHPSQQNQQISREAERIRELVEQALFYARSGHVEKDYFIRECTLSDLLLPALQNHRSSILEKGITLDVEELEEKVCTDAKWLTYILGQILSNSVKYQNKKEPRIHIFSWKEQDTVYLGVEDNGVGISPEELPRIFDKGFTGKDRKKQQATGMGLYLCKRLCGKLGLTLQAQSTQGEVTTITIGFPVGSMHRM